MKKNTVSPKDSKPATITPPIEGQERDLDDLVHEDTNESSLDLQNEDPDDKVHRTVKPTSTSVDPLNPGMEDPDDLVHGFHEDDEQ